MQPTKRFYVYNLTDPSDKIFYVGKGCGPRVHQHEDEARRGCECHKCRKIRKIWRNGGEVRKYIVFETDNEKEAYKYEEEMIASIGLKNLCNKAIGGRGNRSISNEELEARQQAIEYDRAMRTHERDMRATVFDEMRWQADQIKEARKAAKEAQRIVAGRRRNKTLPPGVSAIYPCKPRVKKR